MDLRIVRKYFQSFAKLCCSSRKVPAFIVFDAPVYKARRSSLRIYCCLRDEGGEHACNQVQSFPLGHLLFKRDLQRKPAKARNPELRSSIVEGSGIMPGPPPGTVI